MPFGYDWKCNNCGYQLRTSALWEFYIDEFGLRQKYGHPCPNSEQAKNAGVMGFSAEWYCPTCRSVRDVVVLEFDKSKSGPLAALMAYYDRPETDHEEFEVICDKCGEKLIDDLENVTCCRCNAGRFQEESRFMS
jgi:hypothetical protein